MMMHVLGVAMVSFVGITENVHAASVNVIRDG